jgi:hypothetical protein
MTKRRIITTLLSVLFLSGIVFAKNAEEITLKIPGLSPTTKEWLASWFQRAEQGIIVQDVQAFLNNWQNWPRSMQHKDFDGGWIMPFEVFIQENERRISPFTGGLENPKFTYKPYPIDINGDGRLDLIYSRMRVTLNPYGTDIAAFDGLEQYIALRKSNGYEMAYTCIQTQYGTGRWYYYGDCASNPTTNSLQNSNLIEQPWTPTSFFYEHSINWGSGGTLDEPGSFTDLYAAGKPIYTRPNTPAIHRFMPELMDINGDGLPDVIFGKTQMDLYQRNERLTPQQNHGTYILYNNGRGFDIGLICQAAQENMIMDTRNRMFEIPTPGIIQRSTFNVCNP